MADESTKTDSAPESLPPVEALWVGTFEAQLPDKTVLVPHESVATISGDEAKESDHWQIVNEQPAPKKIEAPKAEQKTADGGKD